MKSYHQYLESSREPVPSLVTDKKPVFRASAIFPVIHNERCTTRVSFMGYWLLKREIKEISLVVTLRNQEGRLLKRNLFLIDAAKAFTIELFPLLEQIKDLAGKEEFLGSLELEIFSTRNLVFPYPAFVLCYYSENFSTSVHTTARVYNDVEDMVENDEAAVPEAGFDIYAGEGLRSFAAFANGPIEHRSPVIEYTVLNHAGKEFIGQIRMENVKPYETVFIFFGRAMDLSRMLEGKPGTIKLKHPFKGFYPRLVVGNFNDSARSVSITHSYYDCSKRDSESDFWEKKDASLYHAAVLVPLFIEDDFYTDLVLYPVYSPSKFSVSIHFYDGVGHPLKAVPHFRKLDTSRRVFERIEFKEIARSHSLDPRQVKGADLICESENAGRFPTRIKMGLNVGRRLVTTTLPTNICFGLKIGNPNRGRPRSFHWAPFLNVGDSVIVLTNSSAQKDYREEALVRLRFYRETDNRCVERQLTIPAHGQKRVELAADEELKRFMGASTGWAVFDSDNPFLYGWYFDFHRSGAVAGDHCF